VASTIPRLVKHPRRALADPDDQYAQSLPWADNRTSYSVAWLFNVRQESLILMVTLEVADEGSCIA
jgi:hypothetical protein